MDSTIDEGVTDARLRRTQPATPADVLSSLRAAAPAALALAALAVALLTQFLLTDWEGTVSNPGYGFLLAVVLLAASAFLVARRSRDPGQRIDSPEASPPGDAAFRPVFELSPRWEVGLVAAVFLLAAFFRFWRLTSFPPGWWFDEGVNANDAVYLIDVDHTRIWFETVFGRSTLYLYLLAGSFKIFGFTNFALRIVPAVSGLAAVVVFYFLARHLLGVIPALVATALFAVSRWAVIFSRVSWEAALVPVLEIASVYFFVRGVERKSLPSFALSGVALAAGLYTYIPFRVIPIVIALLALYVAVTQWRLIGRNIPGILLFAAAFSVTVAPLAWFAGNNWDRVSARQRQVNVFKEIDRLDSYEPLRHNIKATIKMMNVRGDRNGRHNLPFEQMLDEVTGALFVLGLAVSVWSLRNWRRGHIAPWLLLTLIPGALTIRLENPSAIRGIGALAPLYLLVGLALASVYRPLASSRRGTFVFGGIAALLVAGAVVINYHDIFNRMANDRGVYEAFTPEFSQVGEIVAARAGKDRVFVSRQFHSHHGVGVQGHGKEYYPYAPTGDVIFPRSDRDVLLIADINQFAMVPHLRKQYPNLTQEDYVDPFDRVFFTRIRIPAADINAIHDLPLVVESGDTAVQLTGPIDRDWAQADLEVQPLTATWEGHLFVTTYPGSTTFTLHVPGGTGVIEVDGAPLPTTPEGILAPVPLTVGEHQVKVTAQIGEPGRIELTHRIDVSEPRNTSDALYAKSFGGGGFQVVYRNGRDFSAPVLTIGETPFIVGTSALANAQAIEYHGQLRVDARGAYEFAVDGSTDVQLFVDDELAVDNGGAHGRKREQATVNLSAGPHRISILYKIGGVPDFSVELRKPDSPWVTLDGTEFTVPEGEYVGLAIVGVAPDPAWNGGMRQIAGFEAPRAVAVMPDGTVIVGQDNRLAFLSPADGSVQRTLEIDVGGISDVAVAEDGRIAVTDGVRRSLLILDDDGNILQRYDAAFSSAIGVAVQGTNAYVTSPSGGVIYIVPLGGGDQDVLPVSAADAPVRAQQPSDVAVAPDGTVYIADFEKRTILKSADGRKAEVFQGVGGVGDQVPHLALSGKLVIATDPARERVVVLDTQGRLRGVFTFPPRIGGTHPVGVAVAPDGKIYAADIAGFIHRLVITIPPETQTQLDAIP